MNNVISLGEGASFKSRGSQGGPCPKCGSMGTIPAGHYTVYRGILLMTPQTPFERFFLEKALGLVRTAASGEMSVEEFQRQAAATAPELNALWRLLPDNKEQAVQFWLLVLAAITVLLMGYDTFRDEPPSQVLLPQEIVAAIQNARPDGPADSHNEPPPPSAPKPKQKKRRNR